MRDAATSHPGEAQQSPRLPAVRSGKCASARAAAGPPPLCQRWLAGASTLVLGTGCTTVFSSAVSTAAAHPSSTSAVTLNATRDPENAEELGLVEAHGRRPPATLDAIAREFSTRVAKLGADYGRIDSFDTRFENVTETYSYECGTTVTTGSTDGVPTTTYISQTCIGQTEVEVGTLTLTGRAFRTKPATP